MYALTRTSNIHYTILLSTVHLSLNEGVSHILELGLVRVRVRVRVIIRARVRNMVRNRLTATTVRVSLRVRVRQYW